MEVERKIDDLTKEVWKFVDIDFNICLTGYSLLKRESTRHKRWNAIEHFDSYFSRSSYTKEVDVPLPEDVKVEVLNYYIEKLRVCKFSERKR